VVPFPQVSPLLVSPIRAKWSTHAILFDLITRMLFREECKPLSSSLCSFLHSLFTSIFLGPNILLSTLFWNTLSLRSSLNVSDHVSHPHKTTGEITVLFILILICLDSKLEDKSFYADWQPACPLLSLFLFYFWIKFEIFELFGFSIFWLPAAFWSRDMTMYYLSAFTSSPISLQATIKCLCFSF
jgi:hypothetical protein